MNSTIVPSPRPTRRWPYVVTQEQWAEAVRTLFGGEGQKVSLDGYVREKALLSLHRYAIGRAIFCPSCRSILDIARDVQYRGRTVCRSCFLDGVTHGAEKTGPERMRAEILAAFAAGELIDGASFYGCTGRRLRDGKVKPPVALALRVLASDVLETAED